MLPPVQSTFNLTVQNRAPNRQEYGGQARPGQEQMQGGADGRPVAAGLSSPLATNLNFLSLSAPAGSDMDLLRLAQIIGKTLNLAPGQKGEPAALMKQVASTLAALPAVARTVLERQLAPLLQGLPLQTVARALANPTGPEAARVVAFLELSRRGKDAVTQSVVASYQQNEVAETDGFAPLPRAGTTSGETEVKAKAAPLSTSPLEAQLAQAAQAAALKAGIALPLVPYALEDAHASEAETPEREDTLHRREQDGKPAGEDDDATGEQPADAGATDDDVAGTASEQIADATDDMVYSLYARMSGGV